MAVRTILSKQEDIIAEGATPALNFVVQDENGAALPAASLTTLELTLYDKASGTIINTRNNQNALNANNVTVDGSGNGKFQTVAADTAILDATKPMEEHVTKFKWTWASGTKVGFWEIVHFVENLNKNP